MIVKAKIHTNSKKFEVKPGEVWEIHVKNSPENNKANLEIIKELSKIYGECKIIKGKKGKTKILEVPL